MENTNEHLEVHKVHIQPDNVKDLISGTSYEILSSQPHFFIKVDTIDKRYRISASFKYMNQTWDLKINIIRDLNKIFQNKIIKPNAGVISPDIISKLQENRIHIDKLNNIPDVEVMRLFDPIRNTFVFIITRSFKENKNTSVVFFSKDFWDINEYFKKLSQII